MSVNIKFLPDDVSIEAEPGESLLNVADRAGVFIPTGCLTGFCRACEVEIVGEEDYICACISSVPTGKDNIEIQLYEDSNW
jgi:ferredoxin